MNRIAFGFFLLASVLWSHDLSAQWPMDLTSPKGVFITVYQPQLESLEGNHLKGRSAFAVRETPESEVIFGVFWFTATMITDRDNRMLTLESIVIDNVKFPDVEDQTKIAQFKQLLETEIPNWEITASLEEVTAGIESQKQIAANEELKNDPPVIHYVDKLTTLVLIDGEPKLQDDANLKMKRVVNTPFLIVQNPDDKKHYLYGGKFWYASATLKEGWESITSLPKRISTLNDEIKKQEKASDANIEDETTTPATIFVSVVPAELIQSEGKAEYASISGTNLLYVSNSEDDIFKSVNDQKYYVLISGRWYTSAELTGKWAYIAAGNLPEDFKKIPEGSDKDNVLVSVPGTAASKEAVMDAQIPQTAAVDRKTATCTVKYDGEPKFESIEGTSLDLAMNTASTVMREDNKYYSVENGVWFESDNATGPWTVSEARPEEVEDIPASSSAYNTKYVYVYDSSPDVVYVGYTPGYMGCYVYGPTVVYGTGYYYNPWYESYYYPHPYTYGFNMHYNPWTGWSMGFHYSSGYFSYHGYGYGGYGGYWGPPMYRPPYYPPYHGGMYGGNGPTYIHHNRNINIDNSNNIYNRRNDVTTNDINRGNRDVAATRPATQPSTGQNRPATQPSTGQRPATQPSTGQNRPATQPTAGQRPATQPSAPQPRPPMNPADAPTRQTPIQSPSQNNVYGDQNGNVYQRHDNGSWDQRSNNQWQSAQQPINMNNAYQNRERSASANRSYQQMNHGGNMGGGSNSGGGGSRGGGGGGGGRRG